MLLPLRPALLLLDASLLLSPLPLLTLQALHLPRLLLVAHLGLPLDPSLLLLDSAPLLGCLQLPTLRA